MFVKCRGDRKTTAKFLRIQIIFLGASVYVMSFTSYGFIHKKLPGDHNLRGTDLERSLAVYQWLVEARCSTRGTVGLAEMLGILAAGCGLRPRALALERMWIHSRFGTVGDTSSHPGPSRLARHSAHDFMIFCAFCIVSRPPTILKRYWSQSQEGKHNRLHHFWHNIFRCCHRNCCRYRLP